jgi:molybdenum cofactor cytidylyltransferase
MKYPVTSMGIVILAGGQSSRLGRPKQLLQFNGMTLLEKVAAEALDMKNIPVLIVLGAHGEEIKSGFQVQGIEWVMNEHWQEGMASSLRSGIETMQQQHPQVDGILFLVCDQPYLETGLLEALVALQQEKDLPAAASSYGGKLGTPALFHQSVFPRLLSLRGDTGARKLLESMEGEVAVMPFDKGIEDIDTLQDYEKLKGDLKNSV